MAVQWAWQFGVSAEVVSGRGRKVLLHPTIFCFTVRFVVRIDRQTGHCVMKSLFCWMRGYMAPLQTTVLLQLYEQRRHFSSDLLFLVRSVVCCFNLMLVFYSLLFFVFFSAVFCSFVLRLFCVALFSFFFAVLFRSFVSFFFFFCFTFCYLVLLSFISVFCFFCLCFCFLFFFQFASFFFLPFRTLCEIMGSRLILVHPVETIFADITSWRLTMFDEPLHVNELLCGSRLSVLRLVSHVWHIYECI